MRATARRAVGLAALALVGTGALLGRPPPAGAQVTGPCTATIDGQDVSTATSPRTAIEVKADAVATVTGIDNTTAPFTKIKLRFPPLPAITVYDKTYDNPGPDWGGTVKVNDYATFGVGLYHVSGNTDDCTGTAWIKVTGRSPFTTVAGGVGLGLGALGLALAAGAAARARPSFASLLRSLFAGVPLGLGLAVVAQQMSVTPLTGTTLGAWAGGAASVSGLANLAVGALRSGAAAAA